MASYAELKQQAEQLMREAESARKAEIAAAVTDIKAKMATYGISFEDLGGLSRPARGRKAKAGKSGRVAKSAKSAKPTKTAKAKTKSVKARKPVAAKYRNADTGETWTGRGKPPKWLTAMEAAGRKREEFAI